MPRPGSSTTPNPLLEKRRGLFGCFRVWRQASCISRSPDEKITSFLYAMTLQALLQQFYSHFLPPV
jgi:hypothetical protein